MPRLGTSEQSSVRVLQARHCASVMEVQGVRNSCELPPELTLTVMRLMDKRTLEKSAQVCRDWLELSRPYLFASVAYASQASYDQQQPAPLEDLLDFLRATPYVCSSVFNLSLRFSGSSGYRAYCSLQTLAATLRCLPRLRLLEFNCFPLEHSEVPASDEPAVAHLATLKIGGWYRASPDQTPPADILQFLNLFEEIEHLVLGSSIEFPVTNATLSCPRVQSLTLEGVHTLRTVPHFPPIAGLASLQLPILGRDDVEPCRKVLDNVRAHLHDLELKVHVPTIGCATGEADFSYLRELDLASFPLAESVTIFLPVYGEAARPHAASESPLEGPCFYEPAYTFIAGLIPLLPPSMQTLRFKLHYFSLDPYYDYFRAEVWNWSDFPMEKDWAKLDDVLASRVSKGLRQVEFYDALEARIPEVEQQAVVEALPRLWEGGVARFA